MGESKKPKVSIVCEAKPLFESCGFLRLNGLSCRFVNHCDTQYGQILAKKKNPKLNVFHIKKNTNENFV